MKTTSQKLAELSQAKEMFQHAVLDDIEIAIRLERTRQDMKFGPQNHDPFKWLAIIGEEVGEVNNAVLECYHFDTGQWDLSKLAHYREELIQVAAVAKAMIEAVDRGTWPAPIGRGG